MVAAAVLRLQHVERLQRRGQKAPAQWRVGQEADAEFAAGRQDLGLDVTAPQRILGLQRRDRVHAVRAAQRLRAGFGQQQVAHLALLDKSLHRADRVFDRHRLVHAVQAVDVDHVHAQVLQALLASLHHMVGVPAAECRRSGATATRGQCQVAELGADQHILAPALDGLAHQLLVDATAIGVGGREQVDTEVDCTMDRRDRLLVVGRAVGDGHAHAAQAQRPNLRAVRSQSPLLHRGALWRAAISPCT